MEGSLYESLDQTISVFDDEAHHFDIKMVREGFLPGQRQAAETFVQMRSSIDSPSSDLVA
ncbi:hypothetical protein WN51_06570 [Melipona quadrifasciata]|uniref:Uncharacterized protein n=1 Tax=Melipona quadrifasciata TaxID=166423 RepID=A0A0M8ZT76_9HYME|nr:hypothetical protein WN51_06570 [Melipona quadrifasciata]